MKRRITIVFLCIVSIGYAQDFNFKPVWDKGDEKQITITQIEKEYEDDILISDTTIYNSASLKVLKVDEENYTLEILLENQALRIAIEFYDKLDEELKDYQDLKLIYKINKETSDAELQNWKEAQKFMNESFKQITNVLADKASDIAPYMNIMLMPLMEVFESKENIEAYMEDNIGYILIPFNKYFKVGETITTTETGENPFNPMQQISATTLLTLVSVDKEAKTCLIHQEVELDLTEFIEMMKGMMQQMSQSFGANDSITAVKAKEMDAFEMDIENLQVITFDYQTTWITKVVGTSMVSGTDPKKGIKTKTEVITTTEIK
ncbi:hypothetical protein [Crocinitomix catalasitica]|uniref:hypothetical protein n=1 Tax=Crocinitomix catalasitica TaxID=184607 RepID=UPI0004805954|nr:hypothetical protein [Crocinitomix catalasitica]